MKNIMTLRPSKSAISLSFFHEESFPAWEKTQTAATRTWLQTQEFTARAGSFCLLIDEKGKTKEVLVGLSHPISLWDIADLPHHLPEGTYQLGKLWQQNHQAPLTQEDKEKLIQGWLLGGYKFTRYKNDTSKPKQTKLVLSAKTTKLRTIAEAINLGRDLINTPAEDMNPADLANAVKKLGRQYKARTSSIVGQKLLEKNYPAIHRVGRASAIAPRLIDLTWGNKNHPKITLVGKGVCFDTGGLDIKPSSSMALMKKDMGGAATALTLAKIIMAEKLPVRLRVLIPAVDNAISGNAYRTSDIIKMRNGTTVEVGNTDAEGRLVLADALTEAVRENPELLLDFATLTGAARSAVGTDISALFVNDDTLADNLLKESQKTEDPLWRLPLYQPYEEMIKSTIADLKSTGNQPYAGAIVAALFLEHFVGNKTKWAHIDMMGYTLTPAPGRPQGGNPMAARAIYEYLEKKYKKKK